jgi:hypothetical protein
MARLTLLIIAMLFMDVLLDLPGTAAGFDQKADAIPVEDYALYDQVVTSKFLTSATQLVVIERATQFRLSPDQKGPTTIGAFLEQEFFDGDLPADLIREFTAINRQPSRLEGRFHFGVTYRFATGDKLEEPEVSLTVRLGTGALLFCACPRQRSCGTGTVADVGASPLGWYETGSSAVGAGSCGLLSRGAKPPQRSCAAVCRNPTSRQHRSGIPRVVPP